MNHLCWFKHVGLTVGVSGLLRAEAVHRRVHHHQVQPAQQRHTVQVSNSLVWRGF